MRWRTTGLTLGAGLVFAGAVAAESDPDNAIKYRQEIFKTLGANLSAVVMNLRDEVSFPDAVPVHAQTLAATAPLVLPAMVQGTAGEGSAQTQAQPDIWANWDDFTSLNEDMQAAVQNLALIAADGDAQTLGREVQTVAGTCKACHDKYRD